MFVFLNDVISATFFFICCFYLFEKFTNLSVAMNSKSLFILWCALLGVTYTARPVWVPISLLKLIFCLISIIFIRALTKLKFDTVISAFLLSFGIGYILYYMAAFAVAFAFSFFESSTYASGTVIDYNTPFHLFIYSLISALQFPFAFLFFRIRRFRKGFPFLLQRYAVIVALISAGFVLICVTWIKMAGGTDDASTVPLLFCGVLIIGSGVVIWIRRGINSFQWRKTMLRNIELLRQELTFEQEKNARLSEKLETAQSAAHKIIRRLEAMEYQVARMAANTEFDGELAVSLEDIQKLQQEYNESVASRSGIPPLPLSHIKEIDNLFECYAAKFVDNNIAFTLKITGNVRYMTEHLIPQNKLETLIGDHLQDALIAVNASDKPFRSVLAVLGIMEGCYEFSVYDSGIPFTAATLAHLGTEYVTTHKDTGGSGIGFMTTFETMRACGASLVIYERKPSDTDFSKSVSIRFDGKNEYRVISYRPEKFPESDRMIVENVKA